VRSTTTALPSGFVGRLLRLRGSPAVAGPVLPPLTVEVDGMEVAGVRFARSDNPEAAEIISRLQRAGLSVFLASERMCAKQHSIDRYSGNMGAGDKIAFLRDLRRESINAAYIGDCLTDASVVREAYLSIGFATRDAETGAEWEQGAPDINFAYTVDRFAAGTLRAGAGQRQTTPAYAERSHDPNLLCVAGAFAFGLAPMAIVFISNFGTSMAYNGARRPPRGAAIPFDTRGR